MILSWQRGDFLPRLVFADTNTLSLPRRGVASKSSDLGRSEKSRVSWENVQTRGIGNPRRRSALRATHRSLASWYAQKSVSLFSIGALFLPSSRNVSGEPGASGFFFFFFSSPPFRDKKEERKTRHDSFVNELNGTLSDTKKTREAGSFSLKKREEGGL